MLLNLQPGIYPDISERDYHRDNLCEHPTLSSSLAKTLIHFAPIHAWCEHPRLGDKRVEEPTAEMEFGSAAHKLCLGKGAEIAICGEKNWQKKDAQAFRDEARLAGQIPILQHRYEDACAQRDAFFDQLGRRGLLDAFKAATPEVVLLWKEGDSMCRALLDKLFIDEASKQAIIFDIKTTESVNPKKLGKHVWNQDYDLSEQHYTRGLEVLRPDLRGRIKFLFLFLETSFPFLLQPGEINGESRMLGISKLMRAHTTWTACLKAGVWPEYSGETLKIAPPEWALNDEFGQKAITP